MHGEKMKDAYSRLLKALSAMDEKTVLRRVEDMENVLENILGDVCLQPKDENRSP